MVRVLHTADVHLAADHPEREVALEAVLDAAEDEAADLVTIGGDLFDSEADSEQLRPRLRELFSDRPFDVLAIPGNHDEAAFRGDLHFGDAFEAIVEEPFGYVTIDDVRLICVPYQRRPAEEVLLELADRTPFDGPELLVLHGSLEAPFADATTGEESGRRYFPVTEDALGELRFHAILAGHYHSSHRVELPGEGTFVYPGSPASITRGETGQRHVAIVDTDTGEITLPALETFHYDRLEVSVAPGSEEDVLTRIDAWTDSRTDGTIEAEVQVDGYSEWGEERFATALGDAAGDAAVVNRVRDASAVLSHPLFQEFETRLDEYDLADEQLEDDVWERTVSIFAELHREGRIA